MGTGRRQSSGKGVSAHMPTTYLPGNRAGSPSVQSAEKRGPPWGEAANPRPLLSVPGRHRRKVHLLPRYRTREAQHASRLDGPIQGTQGLPRLCQERAGRTVRSDCPMAKPQKGRGAGGGDQPNGGGDQPNEQAARPRPKNGASLRAPASEAGRWASRSPFKMPRLHPRARKPPSAAKASDPASKLTVNAQSDGGSGPGSR